MSLHFAYIRSSGGGHGSDGVAVAVAVVVVVAVAFAVAVVVLLAVVVAHCCPAHKHAPPLQKYSQHARLHPDDGRGPEEGKES